MSINGVYDSAIGDRLARLSLKKHHKVSETAARNKKPLRYCACGAPVGTSPKMRNNEYVCEECAKIIPRQHGGVEASMSCAKCLTKLPRPRLYIRFKQLYCKECAATILPDIPSKPIKYKCTQCGFVKSRKSLYQRKDRLLCERCLSSE